MTHTLTTSVSSAYPWGVRALKTIGSTGALLAFIILAASILLRLTTAFAPDGSAASTLSTEVENAIRLVHRLAAASLGLFAMVAAVLCHGHRARFPVVVQPVLWLVGATVLLAVIGPLTPGYRYSAVTVANVVAGTVLLMACWWLREVLTPVPRVASVLRPMVLTTVLVLVIHIGLGAAASAFAARGVHGVSFIHSGTAMLTTLLLASLLWDRRQIELLRGWVNTMAGLLAAQLVLGIAALWLEGQPAWLGFVHAMVSAGLSIGLVSIAVRDDVPPLAPQD